MSRKQRNEELLTAAATAFSDGRDPFCTDWLVENEVTADECFALSDSIGTILAGFLAAPRDLRQRIALFGATSSAGLPADFIARADEHLRLRTLKSRCDNEQK